MPQPSRRARATTAVRGGIAREEVEAFMIHPVGTPFDFATVEHASDLYRFFTGHYGIDTERAG